MYDGLVKLFKDELLLNDCLEIGDNYILYVFDMLISFWSNLVGFMVDIEKVFLMVSIKEEDWNMFCFFWFDDLDWDRFKIV